MPGYLNCCVFTADDLNAGAAEEPIRATTSLDDKIKAERVAPAEPESSTKTDARTAPLEITSINQITQEKHEEIRLRQSAERERDELRLKFAELADMHTDIEARAEFLAEQKFERYQQDARQHTWNDTCNKVADAGAAEYRDFDETMATLRATGVMRPELIEAALEIADKNTHKVLYHLGKNPAEAARIVGLSPVQMAAALAKIALADQGAQLADLSTGRAQTIALADKRGVLAWGAPVVSAIITFGFFGAMGMIVFTPVVQDVGRAAILNIMVGSLGAGFTAVVVYWLGFSTRKTD